MLRRIALGAVTLGVVPVVTVVSSLTPATAGGPEPAPQAEVTGVLEVVAHGPRGMHYAVRTAEGPFVPVRGHDLDDVAPGSTVTVVVDVPPVVVAAARSEGAVADETGRAVELEPADLPVDGRPTAAGSDLSRATVAQASGTGQALTSTRATVVAAASAAYTTGAHTVTVALAVPRGMRAGANGASAARAQVAAASAYWSEQTRGAVTLRVGSVSAPYVSEHACTDSDDAVFLLWREAERRTGFVAGPDRHLVLSLPRAAADAGCPYGLASVGQGPNAGGVVALSGTDWPVLAHEIGHNFGLGHAKALRCGRADADLRRLPSGCSIEDYGDPFDVMAGSAPDRAGSLSSPQAARLGLLPASQVVDVGSGSRSVTLTARSAGTGTQAVRVTDPTNGEVYFVEFRNRAGRDRLLYKNMEPGVRVVRLDPNEREGRASVALDATPSGRRDDLAWQIPARGTFTSRGGGVTVRVTSTAAATAAVTVTAGAGASRPPVPPRVSAPSVASPRVGAPTVTGTPVAATATAGPYALFAWRGAPRGATYQLRYRTLGVDRAGRLAPSAARTWYTSTTVVRGSIKGRPGDVVQVSARLRTSAGAYGPWSSWSSSVIAVDAGARGVAYRGRWQSVPSRGAYAGRVVTTTARGAALTRPATPTNAVHVLGTRHRKGGKANIYVDGRLRASVDTFARGTAQRQLLATVRVPWGRHTVQVVNAPVRGRATLALDAIAYGR